MSASFCGRSRIPSRDQSLTSAPDFSMVIGDLATELGIAGTIDLTHASSAEGSEYSYGAKPCAGCQCHARGFEITVTTSARGFHGVASRSSAALPVPAQRKILRLVASPPSCIFAKSAKFSIKPRESALGQNGGKTSRVEPAERPLGRVGSSNRRLASEFSLVILPGERPSSS